MSQKLLSAAVVIGALRVNYNKIALLDFLGIRFSYSVNHPYSVWAYRSQGRSQNAAAIVTSKGGY